MYPRYFNIPNQKVVIDKLAKLENNELDSILDPIQENTKIIYVESPSNPLLTIIDLEEISKICKSRNILTVIDNTFASPINQNPIDFGIDIVLHSATKYLGGHSDIAAGAILSKQDLVKKIA